jgi:hypothetical protein
MRSVINVPFLIPEVCNLHIGLRWPIDISINHFMHSLHAAMVNANQSFNTIMLATKPLLSN